MKNKIQRKNFIKNITVTLLSVSIIGPLYLYIKKIKDSAKNKSITVKRVKGISFHDDAIIIDNNNSLSVFSSRCTHLGCKIEHEENNMLLCRCHGSSFNTDGSVAKGPASKSLKSLNFKFSKDKKNITIEIIN